MKLLKTQDTELGIICGGAFDDNDELIIIGGSSSGAVHVYDLKKFEKVKELNGHTEKILDCFIIEKSKYALTFNNTEMICWDISNNWYLLFTFT